MSEGVFIIAEAGVNHNGDIHLAKRMIDLAAEAGADAVKFQTYRTENLVTCDAAKAEYQRESTNREESQFEMLKKLELSPEDHRELIRHCGERGIRFLSTPFDLESIELLHDLGVRTWKIPSGEINNYPYLREIASLGEEVILSTGMSTMEEIGQALEVLRDNGCGAYTLLHCNTGYPTPMEDVNLLAMQSMRKRFRCPVGYSDHTRGIEAAIAAAALSASVIEKHFTLDRTMVGPDHRASLEPEELKAMVSAIRNIQLALGDGKKAPSDSERTNLEVVRKSIVAACDISAGEVFTEENITTKRPGTGLSPMRWREVLGKRAGRDYKRDEGIEL